MTGPALTLETLRIAQRKIANLASEPARDMDIIVSEHALKDSDERLFPESRHRSRRIHKKLVKRHGGVFLKVPCIYRTPQGIIMHPTLYRQFVAELERRQDDVFAKPIIGWSAS